MMNWHISLEERREALKSKGWRKNMWGWYLPHHRAPVGIDHAGLDLEEAEALQRLLDCETVVKSLHSLVGQSASDKEIADYVRGESIILDG